MDAENYSAIALPLPGATKLFADFRLKHCPKASRVLPAHVTLVDHLGSVEEIDDQYVARLRDLFAKAAPISVTLAKTGIFPAADVFFLAPEPDAPYHALTQQILAAFPNARLAFPEPAFHVTLAHGSAAGLAEVEREFVSAFAKALPLHETIGAAGLFVKRAGEWSLHASFPFGGI